MPSSKFVFPPNLGTVKANTQFTIKMAINNLEAGNFVNADQNYYAAPQQINAQGNVVGHTHFVIQAIDSLESTKTLDPQTFQCLRVFRRVRTGSRPSTRQRTTSRSLLLSHSTVLSMTKSTYVYFRRVLVDRAVS